MTEKAPKPGLVLAGRYRLESKLGEGGMGTVWRAEHLVLCAPVAVKVLDRDVSRDEEAHDRFIREARAAAALRSPHVVQTLDYGIDGGFPYIAMELLEGETLATRLTRQARLSPLETARIITHVARAVGRAHDAGIIHRDLKPENVFIVKNEDAEIAKVLDFGVAKVEKAQLGPKGTRTRTGSLLGTPFYMSPEQAQGNKTIDPRSDLWAMGVIAFECLSGKRPFESEGLGDLVLQICVRDMPRLGEASGLPPRFDEWFEKACARDPEQRFQSARELAEAFRETVGAEARETLATIGDDDLPAAPRSVVVVSGRAPASGMDKTISSPRPDDFPEEEVSAAETGEGEAGEPEQQRKPSLTVRQFGTTQSSVPQRSNRAALLLGVAGSALVVGVIAGVIVFGGMGNVSGGSGASDEPSAQSTATDEPPPAATTAAKATIETVADSGASTNEHDDPDASAEESASADAAREQGSEGGLLRPAQSESDKAETKPIVDASTDRDWGKTTDEPPPATDAGKPPGRDPDEQKGADAKPLLPPPPPPIAPDR